MRRQSGPTTGRSRISVLNDLFNRNRYGSNFNIFRGFTANASGHTWMNARFMNCLLARARS